MYSTHTRQKLHQCSTITAFREKLHWEQQVTGKSTTVTPNLHNQQIKTSHNGFYLLVIYFQRIRSKNKNNELFSMEAEFQNFSYYKVSQVPPKISSNVFFRLCSFYHSESSSSFLKKNELRARQVIFQAAHIFGQLQISLYIPVWTLFPPYSKKHTAGQGRAKLSSQVHGEVPLWNSRNLLWMSIHNRFLWLKYCSQTMLVFRKTEIGISQSK